MATRQTLTKVWSSVADAMRSIAHRSNGSTVRFLMRWRVAFNLQRAVIGATVAVLHICLLLLFLQSFAPRATTPKPELEVTVGGVFGLNTQLPKLPKIEIPDPTALAPPHIEISDTPVVAAAIDVAGTQKVTVPAQAIASSHEFPAVPATVHLEMPATVQLILSVSETGLVSDAQVHRSSGLPTLDDVAVAWVKAHWRYRPAMLDGKSVPVKTLAIVIFNLVPK